MDKVSKRLLDIINNKDPIYIEVLETLDNHTYEDLNTIWNYFFKKKKNNKFVDDNLEKYFTKYPFLKMLFEAHYNCKNEHMVLFYCRDENEQILIQFKIDREFHHFIVTSDALIDICKELVDNQSNKVGILIWIND